MEKRQVGVLARSGALPQGKRSVGALARNGELPGKRAELGLEERQRLYRLSNWLREIDAAIRLQEALEHDLAKRNMEAMARAGYLVKPATEPPEPRIGLLDSEDFLGKVDSDWLDAENEDGFGEAEGKRGGLASLARHGYIGKRNDDEDDDDDVKRSIGAARNFLSLADKRNIASVKSFISRYGKRNLGSFRNFGSGKRNLGSVRNSYDDFDYGDDFDEKRNVGSARRFQGKRNLGAARNFLFTENKKNLGAARQFFASGNKKNLGAARNFYYGKRNIASFARDGGFNILKHSGREDDYPWEDEDEFDFDDFHEDDKRHLASFLKNQSGKRYLGSLRAGKRNVAAFRNFGKRLADADTSGFSDSSDEDVNEFLGKELDGASTIEKRETKETKDGGAGQGQGHEGGTRRKRAAEFAFSPNELNPDLQDYGDYEDDLRVNSFEKRFLGSKPRMVDSVEVGKRHIGALARLGLLPSFRSTRYSRSGRAISNRIVPFRENPTVRACSSKDSTATWSATPPVEAKLALRRSSPMAYASWSPAPQRPSSPMAYAPYTSRTRHPMAFHRSIFV